MFDSIAAFLVCSIAIASSAFGIVLTLLQLPGNWLIVLVAALVAWWGWEPVPEQRLIGWAPLFVLLAIAIAAEIAEFVLSAWGARRAGGTRRAAIYAMIGGIVGALVGSAILPIPIVGTLVGAAVFAALGSFLGDRTEGRDVAVSMTAARGAAVGRLTASAAKLAAGVAMWFVAAFAMVF